MTNPDSEMRRRVTSIAASVFHVREEALKGVDSRDEVAEWDSLAHLNLVMELEKQFIVQFTTRDIEEMTSLSRIVFVVGCKGKS